MGEGKGDAVAWVLRVAVRRSVSDIETSVEPLWVREGVRGVDWVSVGLWVVERVAEVVGAVSDAEMVGSTEADGVNGTEMLLVRIDDSDRDEL